MSSRLRRRAAEEAAKLVREPEVAREALRREEQRGRRERQREAADEQVDIPKVGASAAAVVDEAERVVCRTERDADRAVKAAEVWVVALGEDAQRNSSRRAVAPHIKPLPPTTKSNKLRRASTVPCKVFGCNGSNPRGLA